MADPGGRGHDGRVYTSGSFLVGPLVAFGVVGILVLVLRWAFSRGGSLVVPAAKPGRFDDYGLLTTVAAPSTYIEGEMQRRALEDAGVRANLAQTLDGPRIMVFPKDAEKARRILDGLR